MGLLSSRGDDDGNDLGDLSIAGLEDLDARAEESVYELDDWSDNARIVLRERLETLAVPHSWESEATLVVSAVDEAWVERIMDQVEDDLSTTLDPEVPQIAYDLTSWDVDARQRLFDALDDEAVPYGLDGEELFIHEIDEVRVDELIESVTLPDGAHPPEGSAAGAEVMGDLFVAADQLVNDPLSDEGALALADAARVATGVVAPYGMDKVWWEGVLREVEVLAALLDSTQPEPNAEAIEEQSRRLRDGLRPYV